MIWYFIAMFLLLLNAKGLMPPSKVNPVTAFTSAVYNEVTKQFMEVVNGRGNAYALRSAFCYREKRYK